MCDDVSRCLKAYANELDVLLANYVPYYFIIIIIIVQSVNFGAF